MSLFFASDLSTKVLKQASNAVYDESRIKDLPIELKRKYFLKSKDASKRSVRVVAALRNKVKFNRINLLVRFSNSFKFMKF